LPATEKPWIERNSGTGVSHGKMLNSHLTMFNGLVRQGDPAVPEWDEPVLAK
jgi:hypothetical protein